MDYAVILLAFWMYGTPMELVVPVDTYDSKQECIDAAHSVGYDTVIQENKVYTILDNGVQDSFGLNCQANVTEV